jgi:hypothetical protein
LRKIDRVAGRGYWPERRIMFNSQISQRSLDCMEPIGVR